MAAWLSGNSSAAERDELMAWADATPEGRAFFDAATRLWALTAEQAYPDFAQRQPQAWQQLEQRLDAAPSPTLGHTGAIVRPLWRGAWRVAAAVVVLAVATWLWLEPATPATFVATTAAGERTQVQLADGTQVWLNENTQLTYALRDGERHLTLVGEAYFDVATDSLHPFRVHTQQAVTTVLGTAFNLRAYPNDTQVELAVSEGRVALERLPDVPATTATTARIELAAGQSGAFDKTTTAVRYTTTDDPNTVAWKDRRLNFNDVPLSQVVTALERYYDVRIRLENPALGQCRFYGEYNDDPQLDYLLDLLEASLGIHVQRSPNEIVLSGDGCE